MDVRLKAPPAVVWIARTLEGAGFETWAVGGAVRDVLLGKPSDDWDLATRAQPTEVRRLFRRTVPIGIEHGTVGVLAKDGVLYEVTTFRRDVITNGRHAIVEFSNRIEEDLARRDFTINAIAWHPLKNDLLDPFGGAEDLKGQRLRTVGDAGARFSEDYLRVLRALRFSGRFELDIDPDTWSALVAATDHLDILSRERVREELFKVLRGDDRPSRALELYRSSGALAKVAPELAAIPSAAWKLALEIVEALPASRALLRLAVLLQEAPDIPDAAAALMIRLRFSNRQIERVTALLRAGAEPPPADAPPADLRRFLGRVGPRLLPDLMRLWSAREQALSARGLGEPGRARAAWSVLKAEVKKKVPLTLAELAIDGGDLIALGMKPGPRFRVVLEGLLERVLEDPLLNDAAALRAIVEREMEDGRTEGASR